MISAVIFFLLGILTLHTFSVLPSVNFLIFSSMSGLLFWYAVLAVLKNTKNKTIFSIGNNLNFYWMVAFIFGFLWTVLHGYLILNKQLPLAIEGQRIKVVGMVTSIPEKNNNTLRFEFDVKETIPKHLWQNPGKIRLHWQSPGESVTVGQEWALTVKLKRPRSYANPGSFDVEKHFFQNKINALGKVIDIEPFDKLTDDFWSHPIDRLRSKIQTDIKQALSGNPFAGLIIALVVGAKDDISKEQWAVFRNTGTAHLMAISGLHVGLVASFAYGIMYFLWRRLPIKYLIIPTPTVASLFALGATCFYALLAGLSIPTLRALIMIFIFMLGRFYKRLLTLWQRYFLALGGVLLIDPLATLSNGFWLSFGAVGFIIYGMQSRVQPRGLWWRFGRAQWVVFIGLMPFSLAAFQQLSLVSPLANSIAIPWVSFLVVPCSLIGTLVSSFSGLLGAIFLKLAAGFFALLWPFLNYLHLLPKSVYQQSTPLSFHFGIAVLGCLLCLAPKGFPGRYFGILWIVPLLWQKPDSLEQGMARFTVLDVGQGLAAVIETQNHLLVYDTGPKLSAEFDTGEKVIVPFLQIQGKQIIDALVISHGDNDHVGGAKSLLEKLKVNSIITSEPALFPDKAEPCWAGQQWQWDGVVFEMLHPDTLTTKKRNDHSCVLRVLAGKQSVLLTGDIEAKSEQKMISRIPHKLASPILLVPHHGSRTSSSPEFIQAVKPHYAIIPVGYRNRYGHPKPDIVERYKNLGITVFDTVQDGAITFLLQDQSDTPIPLPPTRYRVESKRYWGT